MPKARAGLTTGGTRRISIQPRIRIMKGRVIAFGPGKASLLGAIEETGSIAKAALKLEMSYARAWTLVRTMNDCFRVPLVETLRGGEVRGGALLTEAGREVLTLYQALERRALKGMEADTARLLKLLR